MSPCDNDSHLPRLLTKAQVLAIVPLSFPTVWKMMRAGTFPAARTIGSRPMWLESEISEWLRSQPMRPYKPWNHSPEDLG
jgi:predicted DNA-binding transcriptional regulator AlpA